MIGALSGNVIEKDFSSCLIDVNGVGYEVLIPLSTFDKLPLDSGRVTLYIHTAVREDAITLFGFASKEEKKLFQQLIGVSGVGGKLALNVLSAMPASLFHKFLLADQTCDEERKARQKVFNGIHERINVQRRRTQITAGIVSGL